MKKEAFEELRIEAPPFIEPPKIKEEEIKKQITTDVNFEIDLSFETNVDFSI